MRRSSFRKFFPLFLTVGFVLVSLIFAQQAHAVSYNITVYSIPEDNSYVDIKSTATGDVFWGDVASSTPVVSSSLDIHDSAGVATTSIQIVSITATSGAVLVGGESVIRVFINVNESVNLSDSDSSHFKIGPAASYEIYRSNGNKIGSALSDMYLHNPLAPQIVSAIMAADDSYVDITFNKGIWGDDGASEPVVLGSFSIPYNISYPYGFSLVSASTTDGSDLVGNETTIRINLSFNGNPHGNESVVIRIGRGTVFDGDGEVDWGRKDMFIQFNPFTPEVGSVGFDPSSGWVKIGDTITLSIIADYAGDTAGEITINGKPIDDGSFTDNGDGTYSVTYTVEENDNDIADAAQIPISVVLQNGAASSTAFTTSPAAENSPAIDAHPPVVTFSIPKDFYGPNSFIVDTATTTATIIGHWSDANDATTADLVVRRSDTNEIWGNGNFEIPWIESDPGIGNLGILGWFQGTFGAPTYIWFSNNNGLDYDPDGTFEDGVTYTYTFRSIDAAGNLTEVSDSFTWFPDSTTQTTVQNDILITATSSAGNIDITIPAGTEITKDDGSAFDPTAITSDNATNVILGSSLMTAGVTLQGAVQFGISGVTLHFSNPITIRIPVTVPNGTVLDIRRSPDGGATWTTAGFTASATDTCLNGNGNHPVTTVTIAGGFATIFTCQASDFATYSYSQPSSSYYYGGGGGTTTTTSTSTATTTTTTSTTTASTTPLTSQDLLASLIAQLKALILQAKALGISVSPAAQAFVQVSYSFTRDLQFGMTGEDVRQLQVYLNSKGFTVALSGPGSLGNETTYFGPATRAALIKFQKASGISPALGYFGPKTRAYIGLHL